MNRSGRDAQSSWEKGRLGKPQQDADGKQARIVMYGSCAQRYAPPNEDGDWHVARWAHARQHEVAWNLANEVANKLGMLAPA